jgi:hypothetical protein
MSLSIVLPKIVLSKIVLSKIRGMRRLPRRSRAPARRGRSGAARSDLIVEDLLSALRAGLSRIDTLVLV